MEKYELIIRFYINYWEGLVFSKKGYPKKVFQICFIQINPTVYQRYDATPLYIQNAKEIHSLSNPP